MHVRSAFNGPPSRTPVLASNKTLFMNYVHKARMKGYGTAMTELRPAETLAAIFEGATLFDWTQVAVQPIQNFLYDQVFWWNVARLKYGMAFVLFGCA